MEDCFDELGQRRRLSMHEIDVYERLSILAKNGVSNGLRKMPDQQVALDGHITATTPQAHLKALITENLMQKPRVSFTERDAGHPDHRSRRCGGGAGKRPIIARSAQGRQGLARRTENGAPK